MTTQYAHRESWSDDEPLKKPPDMLHAMFTQNLFKLLAGFGRD
jgi:hypothetical protein